MYIPTYVPKFVSIRIGSLKNYISAMHGYHLHKSVNFGGDKDIDLDKKMNLLRFLSFSKNRVYLARSLVRPSESTMTAVFPSLARHKAV